MSFANALRRRQLGREYPLRPNHVCEFCFGPLEVVYDYEAMAKKVSRKSIAQGPLSVWRYADFLPCEGEPVDLQAGFTPLIPAKNLGGLLGLKHLYLKNDCVNLVAVDGSYDDVNRLCAELGDRYKWAFVNINIRPYYSEGSKTLGYEVAEQLGWRAPDHCVVPLASGSL